MGISRYRTPIWFTTGAAIGLLTAVLTTQAFSVAATENPPESSFVAIAPCRLLDTRSGSDNVGPRSTPVTAGEELVVQVTGSAQGRCLLPSSATAVSINLTAVGA